MREEFNKALQNLKNKKFSKNTNRGLEESGEKVKKELF